MTMQLLLQIIEFLSLQGANLDAKPRTKSFLILKGTEMEFEGSDLKEIM